MAQQLLEQNRTAVEKTLRTVLKDGTPGQQLKAVELLLKMGLSAERLDAAEHRDDQQHKSREELVSALVDKLNGGSLAGQLVRAQLDQNVVDGDAVEVE